MAMLDAIGIKLPDASAPRAEAQQDSGRREQAPAAGATAAVGAGGPYYSPVLRLDSETQRTVIQYRDVATGKVQIQYPSERQLEAYRASMRRQREEEAAQPAEGQAPGREAEGGRMAQASAALKRASDSIASGMSSQGWGGTDLAGGKSGQASADAGRPATRPTTITA
jgi:hypothetical protein